MGTIDEYGKHLRGSGKKAKTIRIELYTAGLLGAEPKTATQKDIDGMLSRIATMDLSVTTQARYRYGLRLYLQWAGNPLASGIKLGLKRKTKTRGELLDTNEIQRLMEAATTARDKAIIAVMLESGFRVGEMISCRVRDLVIEPEGYADLSPSEDSDTKTGTCKTGSYSATLIDSLPAARAWLEEHPNKHTKGFKDGALFARADGAPLEYHGYSHLFKRLAKRAGITKRIHPHLLRHCNATMLALKGWSAAEINMAQGRTQDSTIANTYIHMINGDIRKKKLRERGLLKDGGQDDKPVIVNKGCWKCGTDNPEANLFCFACKAPLKGSERFEEVQTAVEIFDALKSLGNNSKEVAQAVQGIKAFMQNEQVQQLLLQMAQKIPPA